MAESIRINIAAVGTQQAATQTKTLKQQIKELRLELEKLTPDTQEYNAKLVEMGNLMHQQSEITNQARMATQDYGQTLSNLTAISNGVVGSFAAMNGMMTALGATNQDATEAIKTMTSLMSVMQGLSALDQAEKNFNQLWNKIKLTATATKDSTVQTTKNTAALNANSTAAKGNATTMNAAAKGTKAQAVSAGTATKANTLLSISFRNLGRAIKAFMASNPFTLILLGLTAAISLVSNLISKTKEEKEEMKKLANETRIAQAEKSSGAYNAGETEGSKRGRAWQTAKNAGGYVEYDARKMRELENLQHRLEIAQKNINKYGEARLGQVSEQYVKEKTGIKEINSLYEVEMALMETRAKINGMLLKQLDDQISKQEMAVILAEKEYNVTKARKGETDKKTQAAKEQLEVEKKVLEGLKAQHQETVNGLNAIDEKQTELESKHLQDEENNRKKNNDAWKNLIADQLKALDERYALEKKKLENQYNKNEVTTEGYYNQLITLENNYYEEYEAWAKKYNQSTEKMEAQHNATIIDLDKKLATERLRLQHLQDDPTYDIDRAKKDRQAQAALLAWERTQQDNVGMLQQQQAYYDQELEMEEAWWLKKLALYNEYQDLESQRQLEANGARLQLQLERLEQDREIMSQTHQAELDDLETMYAYNQKVLDDQLANNLISQQAYDEQSLALRQKHILDMQELDNQYLLDVADIESEIAQTRLDIQQNEFELEQELFTRRMELEKAYINAFSTMVSAVDGLLGELQSSYEEGTKQYQQIQEAKVIMETITGSLSAFMSGVESGIPAPYNFILGGVLASIATATGVAALANLKSKKLSSSVGSAPTVNPYETLSYETNSEIAGNITDSRCYVLEQDITETQNRVSVAETEASF